MTRRITAPREPECTPCVKSDIDAFAAVFRPGEFVRDELKARGWSQAKLATILDCPPRLVREIVSGKRAVTPETAEGLARAFGTGVQFWLNLESAYQLREAAK